MTSLSIITFCLQLVFVLLPRAAGVAYDLMLASDTERFCQQLPKIECHAHLSGSIPMGTLEKLHAEALVRNPGLGKCPNPAAYTDIKTFFGFFTSQLYKIIDSPQAVTRSTKAVLDFYKADGCMYLELRTTPRALGNRPMTDYLEAVYEAFENHRDEDMMVRLILSVDWKHTKEEADQIVEMAIQAKDRVPNVVGIDVCGNPELSNNFKHLCAALKKAQDNGLKVTAHFAEIKKQLPKLEQHLKEFKPNRLGHASFLTQSIRDQIIGDNIPIEICITSNLRSGSVKSLEEHHFKWAVENQVPVLISTDDILIFETTLTKEYQKALYLLNGDLKKMITILRTGILHTFCSGEDQKLLLKRLNRFETENNLHIIS